MASLLSSFSRCFACSAMRSVFRTAAQSVFTSGVARGFSFFERPAAGAPAPHWEAEQSGYLLVPNEKIPQIFNAGIFADVAAAGFGRGLRSLRHPTGGGGISNRWRDSLACGRPGKASAECKRARNSFRARKRFAGGSQASFGLGQFGPEPSRGPLPFPAP